jgi:sodium transport system ATP-binding protein
MIELTNVSKHFQLSGKQKKELATTQDFATAVDQLSFTCHPGRVFSLLGPNGAGKTTTLRMIATLLQPTSGEIKVNGLSTTEHPNKVRASIGFLTGSTGLYERLTPNELITYFGKLHGMEHSTIERRKSNLYDLLDVHEFQNKRIGKLSTGMRQKVSICRTMIHDPEVVIFDEPTSGLDVITAKNIIQLIGDCKAQGKTVIFSSHIMSEVDLLCDDLAIIHKGKLLFNDTLDAFKSSMTTDGLTSEFIHLIENAEKQ